MSELPPFSLLRDFSFQNTSEHFAIRFRQSYLIWAVYDVTAIELSEGIRMAPNYPVNLRWRVISCLVRGFRVVDVARILHVWQIFVKKFRHFFRIKYLLGGLSYAADGKRAFNLVNKLNRSVK